MYLRINPTQAINFFNVVDPAKAKQLNSVCLGMYLSCFSRNLQSQHTLSLSLFLVRNFPYNAF